MLYGCTIPFRFAGGAEVAAEKLRDLPLSPLINPATGGRLSIPDTVQNILLFVPFGVLGLFAGQRTLVRVLIVTGLGISFSMSLEAIQLFTADRVTSVADIATNTLGALAGATGAMVAGSAAARTLTRLERSGWTGVSGFYPMAALSVVTVVMFCQPFDVTLDVGTLVSKVKTFVADPLQFTGLRDEGLTLLMSALLSGSVADYLRAVGRARPAHGAFLVIAGLCAFLESIQLFITSRMPGLWDVAVAAVGSGAGVMLWTAGARRATGLLRLAGLAIATAVAAASLMLSPFHFTSAYHSFGWFPLYAYYSRTTFEGLSHVLEQLIVYFPLGFLASPAGRPTVVQAAGAAVVTLAIAGPIEYLQGWVDGRYPDVTDAAVALFGMGLGLWLAGLKPAHTRTTIGVEFGR